MNNLYEAIEITVARLDKIRAINSPRARKLADRLVRRYCELTRQADVLAVINAA